MCHRTQLDSDTSKYANLACLDPGGFLHTDNKIQTLPHTWKLWPLVTHLSSPTAQTLAHISGPNTPVLFWDGPLKAFLWFCLLSTSSRYMWPPWFLSTKCLLQTLKFTPKDSDVGSFSFCSLFCDTEEQTQSLLQTIQVLYHRTLPHSQLPNLSSWQSQAAVNCPLANAF